MTVFSLVAVVLLVIAVALLIGSPRSGRLLLLPANTTGPPGRQVVAAVISLGAAMLVLVFAGGLLARWLTFVIAGGEVTVTAVWLIARTATARQAVGNERQVIKACSLIAGQLDIGEIPAKALAAAAEDIPLLASAAGAVQVGGSVTDELARLARRPGCDGFDQIARGWRLCERTGMPLGPVMRQVAEALRQSGDIRDQRRAELATSRSTSRLLAALPAVGLGMGFLVGTNPLAFISGSMIGHLCLIGAATLASAGLIWTEVLTKE